MTDFVSTRWVRMVALMVSMAIVWVLFVPDAFPWKVVLLLSLAFSVAFWLRHTPARQVVRVVEGVEAGRSSAVVTPHRVAASVPKAVH
jgi:hypothetical protein